MNIKDRNDFFPLKSTPFQAKSKEADIPLGPLTARLQIDTAALPC